LSYFPEDDKTLVRITHIGLESFPQHGPDFAVDQALQKAGTTYWASVLKEFVEKTNSKSPA
jgi:hypothetical protein